MSNEFLQKIRLSKALTNNMELRAAELLVQNQINIFLNTMQHENENIIWTNMVMIPELMYAARLVPIQTELIAGWLSTLNLSQKYINIAHQKGFNGNICSYHKAVIGALEAGVLPAPKAAVFSSHICDGGSLMIRYLKERFCTKVKLLDVPYYNTLENRSTLTNQLEQTIRFLEEYKGEKVTRERLNRAVQLSNEARQYFAQANTIRKVKNVFYGHLAIRNMYGLSFLFGSDMGVKIAETYYKELVKKEAIAKKSKRILWIHFAPLYAGALMRDFEERLGCIIAFDITGYIYWETLNEKAPVHALAKKMLSHFYLGDTNSRIRLYESIVKDYKIDGIVMFMQQGCRAIPCSSWELKVLSRKIKVPFLEISGDCINPEGLSFEQTRLRMEAFAEGLDNKTYVYGN
jgi:benzoyl-CoA reductase/2-hydroxyglutaryl-CoA dehydratase subunit BcrC/BadD/HgdB